MNVLEKDEGKAENIGDISDEREWRKRFHGPFTHEVAEDGDAEEGSERLRNLG